MKRMTTEFRRHTYQVVFHSDGQVDGALVCPRCKDTQIHPSGHTRQVATGEEYGPDVGIVGRCECGAAVEIMVGNYKGHLGMDVVLLST